MFEAFKRLPRSVSVSDAVPVASPPVSATGDDLARLSDVSRIARIGLWTLVLGFGGFLL